MDIKIYMCCHREYDILPPLCIPMQGGAALNPAVKGTLPDSTGDSISPKNREYCELTVMYHAWKNDTADYFGLCHYRRFFCFKERTRKPYLAKGSLTQGAQRRLLSTAERLKEIIPMHDVVVPRAEDMGVSVREHYASSPHHFAEDLELFYDILCEKYPHMKSAADEYLSQSRQYFCNMFIMKRGLFCEYCSMLFSVLDEFDRRKTLHGDFQSDRTDGYLGERFVGIYLTYLKSCGADLYEISRLDTHCPPAKQLLYHLLPPESKRRLALKRLMKKTG